MKFTYMKICSILLVVILLFSMMMTASAADKFQNTHKNTGDQRTDIVAVAKTQIGYREGDNNDTKYGTWYGLPNQPWCAMFVSWCARQAGVPLDILRNCAIAAPDPGYFDIPFFDGLEYTPERGDLFFTKTFSHVGIVDYVDGEYFYTVEGNTNDTGSSMGIGVFSLKRTIADYYFGVPDYNYKSLDHDCNNAVFVSTEDEHPHFSRYICSYCQKIHIDSASSGFSSECEICMDSNIVLLGDANSDKAVNIKDATHIQKHLAGIVVIAENNLGICDTDGDDNITIKDATTIQKHLAGMFSDSLIGQPT